MDTLNLSRKALDVFKQLLDMDVFDNDQIHEILDQWGDKDFEVANYRFIHTDHIDQIMKDELLSDTFVLGGCATWFIAEVTRLDIDVIEKGQKAKNYELLGELMAKHIDKAQEKMVSYDGYGQHFGLYDSNEIEIEDYHVFRIN